MKRPQLVLLVICYMLLSQGLLSQMTADNISGQKIYVNKTVDPINLDGAFNEKSWQLAKPANQFNQNFPTDSIKAFHDTEVYMTYDQDNLYVFIKCYSKSNKFIVPSLRRDYDFFGNDNITILFDTYNDNTNALVFGMNPYGARREATIANSGQEGPDFDDSWDNKWKGESKMYEDMWTCEMAIPFSTLRFSKGAKKWRFNCYRFDTQSNEITTWIGIPRNRFVMDLGYMGEMVWEEPLEKTGRNISIIPYVSSSLNRNFEDASELATQSDVNAGFDAKISLTSGLNLDLTVNPDFSQVEVDQQVTNLDRFEIFFPERRQFFLENADLFGRFAAGRLNPFFSRRIGVSVDPNTGQNIQNTILYGARLSGKINDKLRVGLLNMQTASEKDNGLPGFNYTVATAEQRISKSSRVAIMGVNKQGINAGDFAGGFNIYNRVLGAEYRLNSPDNQWTGKSTFMKSFTPGVEDDTDAHFGQLVYNTRKFRVEWVHLYLGNGFITETGFTPRKDVFMISPEFSYNFYPENTSISQHTLGFDASIFWKLGKDGNPFITDFGLEEINFEPFWSAAFKNTAMVVIGSKISSIKLLRDFDPTRVQKEGIVLPAGERYNITQVFANFESNQSKIFSYNLGFNGGSFYGGNLFGLDGSLTYRYQPLGFVSMDFSYNRLDLGGEFEAANLWLLGPRIDFTFSKNLFLTTFVQYNSQLDNLNINTRFQWRFAPVSDFFIVYTDNYLTNPWDRFGSRNRALVAKMTYWFNL